VPERAQERETAVGSGLVLKLFFGSLRGRKAPSVPVGWQSRDKNAGVRTTIGVDSDFQPNPRHFQCVLGKRKRMLHERNYAITGSSGFKESPHETARSFAHYPDTEGPEDRNRKTVLGGLSTFSRRMPNARNYRKRPNRTEVEKPNTLGTP
jgi:hypothetical protein